MLHEAPKALQAARNADADAVRCPAPATRDRDGDPPPVIPHRPPRYRQRRFTSPHVAGRAGVEKQVFTTPGVGTQPVPEGWSEPA